MTASTELLPSVRLKVSLALLCTLTVYLIPASLHMYVAVECEYECERHLNELYRIRFACR